MMTNEIMLVAFFNILFSSSSNVEKLNSVLAETPLTQYCGKWK